LVFTTTPTHALLFFDNRFICVTSVLALDLEDVKAENIPRNDLTPIYASSDIEPTICREADSLQLFRQQVDSQIRRKGSGDDSVARSVNYASDQLPFPHRQPLLPR